MLRPQRLTALALILTAAGFHLSAGSASVEESQAPAAFLSSRSGETSAPLQVRDKRGKSVAGVKVRVSSGGNSRDYVTDAKGTCRLAADPAPGAYRIELEGDGFQPMRRDLTIAPGQGWPSLRFTLRPVAGAVVEVTGGMQAEVAPKLRNEIITTEVMEALDIQKTNAVSLVEAVDCKPGISIQTECSICNVRNVVLNNLPGRFTTIMIDSVPIFSSVSGAYGLEMIGVNGVGSIDISRGAGVSLIAPEALAGTVNIIPKRPEKAERVVELQGGDGGFRKADLYFGQPLDGGAIVASFTGLKHDSLDGNGNRVSEYTGYTRYLGGLGFFLDNVAGFKVRGRLDLVDEDRGGGAMGTDYDNIKLNMSGNPFDWSKGKGGSPDSRGWIRPDGDYAAAVADGQNPILLSDGRVLVPYDSGRGGFSELITTKRQQGVFNAERDLGGNRRLKLAVGAARHDQDSFYEGDYYKAKQNQYFVEAGLQWFLGETLLSTGLSYRYEDLKSHSVLADGTAVNGLDNYEYKTPAAYLQVYRGFFGGKLELNGSVRYDDNNVFGGITTPRVNLLWHHTERINSRLAVGRGFRMPTSFFEQDHGILSTTRIERLISRPEKSDNASYTFSAGGEHMAFTMSASYNKIRNYALLDSSATDPDTGAPITVFTQSDDPVVVKGLDATWTIKLPGHVEATLGAERYSYDFTPGTLSFSRPEERAYVRVDYDSENINFFARGTWTGTQDLRRFYDYDNNPRYNMDGTRKMDRSPAFWTVDTSLTWKFTKHASLILSVNNLFDFKQTDYEDFLWIDSAGSPDVTQVWGPGRGRSFQAGLRMSF